MAASPLADAEESTESTELNELNAGAAKFQDPIMRLVLAGRWDEVAPMLKGKSKEETLRIRDDNHFTVLHHAAKDGQLDVARYLIETLGLDVDEYDGIRCTPLCKPEEGVHISRRRPNVAEEGVNPLCSENAEVISFEQLRVHPKHHIAEEGVNRGHPRRMYMPVCTYVPCMKLGREHFGSATTHTAGV